ncbi:signal peptidase I [Halorubrum sp. LN27]|uniref:signal peptidase I n=1 Tax=Halorubrum sp. LN27 TaxID=2801032 RepID=UPI0019095C94|nr:signal peptidase I [Halorubrum sp. LN27]
MTNPLTSRRTKRAANVLGIVLLIALVAPFAVFAAPELVGADESFVVLTPSMTPAIAPGDVVIVAERDPASIAEGDVITFARGTSDVPVTHRVIGVVDEGDSLAFETQGDANEGPDPGLVPAANLVGAVTLTIPYIGYVVQFAGTRAGFAALVLLPFGLLAVTEVWSIVRGRDGSESPASPPSATDAPPAAEPPATDAPPADRVPADGAVASGGADSGGVSVDAVGGAAAVLAAFAPYAVVVAFQLRTAVAVAVAVGASTLLLGALAAWVPASGVLDRGVLDRGVSDRGGSPPEPDDCDGTDETGREPSAPVEEPESPPDHPPAVVAEAPGTPPAQPDGGGEVD